MELTRSSGILLHITSLPGGHGIGDLGREARWFADTLAGAGQGVWQILPLVPTGYGNSPYQGLSVFAGNPLLIDLDDLKARGLLSPADLAAAPVWPEDRVDFNAVAAYKLPLLRKAAAEFRRQAGPVENSHYEAFCRAQAGWLDDFSHFMAARNAFPGKSWNEWPQGLAQRLPEVLDRFSREHAGEVEYHRFSQFIFYRQWGALKGYCAARGLRVMGDVPIFVAMDSADVWQRPGLYHLDQSSRPTVVAGVPPDYFSEDGQRWGNPLYRWDVLEAEGFGWWVDRIRAARELYDIIRLDHFRGFESYWEIPVSETTAREGRWVPGPGKKLFAALEQALGPLSLVAEDLGLITPAVERLREELGLPGMRVLQFAFGPEPIAEAFRPLTYPANCVVYTGTHDNDTTLGWFRGLPESGAGTRNAQGDSERRRVLHALAADGHEINWDLIRLAWATPARLAVAPLQDVLGLGSEARMNRPGNMGANWAWRFRREDLKPDMTARLGRLTQSSQRAPRPTT